MSERPPIAWDAVAAELAARLAAAEQEHEPDWDDVAAQLAQALGPRTASVLPEAEPALEPEAIDEADAGEAPVPADGALVPAGDAPDDAPDDALDPGPVSLELLDAEDGPDEVEETTRGARPVPRETAAAPADPQALRGGLEALLFVVDSPVDEQTLAAALDCTVDEAHDAMERLAAEHEQRAGGVTLRRVAGGWRFYTRAEHARVVERHLLGGQRNRLTQAALGTLAVIAYQQPVTRARVAAVRGVGVDAVMRTLVNRGLVREVGSDPSSGGGLYGTTALFLERLGLGGLDELPALGPLLPDPSTVPEDRPPR